MPVSFGSAGLIGREICTRPGSTRSNVNFPSLPVRVFA